MKHNHNWFNICLLQHDQQIKIVSNAFNSFSINAFDLISSRLYCGNLPLWFISSFLPVGSILGQDIENLYDFAPISFKALTSRSGWLYESQAVLWVSNCSLSSSFFQTFITWYNPTKNASMLSAENSVIWKKPWRFKLICKCSWFTHWSQIDIPLSSWSQPPSIENEFVVAPIFIFLSRSMSTALSRFQWSSAKKDLIASNPKSMSLPESWIHHTGSWISLTVSFGVRS